MLACQKKHIKDLKDKHIYNFMFVAGLEKNINAEVLHLSESLHMENIKFNEVYELAKRGAQTYKLKSLISKNPDGAQRTKGNNKPKETLNKSGSHHSGKINRDKLSLKEKEFLINNVKHARGLIIYENVCNKWEQIKWIQKLGLCIKCAVKRHRTDECTSGSFRLIEVQQKLNAMVLDNSADSRIEIDFEYLCSIYDQRNVLLMYHCETNNVQGTALLDTGAIRNYISRKFAEKANLKFRDTAELQQCVNLPNGHDIKILGHCKFKLRLSE